MVMERLTEPATPLGIDINQSRALEVVSVPLSCIMRFKNG